MYRLGRERFLLVPNASNTDAALAWLERWTPDDGDVEVVNLTEQTAMVACQGPQAAALLQQFTDDDLSKIRPFRAASATVNGKKAYMARTGYTGEDGFEIMLPGRVRTSSVERAGRLGRVILRAGSQRRVETGGGVAAPRQRHEHRRQSVRGGARPVRGRGPRGLRGGRRAAGDQGLWPFAAYRGFKLVERGIARQGYAVLDDEGQDVIGHVTSGGPSPTLDMNIGLGYVPIRFAEPGTRIRIEIRGRPTAAEITTLPFYQRSRSA